MLWQEPGRPGNTALTALALGRTNQQKSRPEDSPETSTNGSYPSNHVKNRPTLRKQDPSSRDLGEKNKKNRNFLKLPAFRKVKAGTIGGTGKNGL